MEELPAYPTGIETKVFESAIKCCENVLDKMKDMSKEELLEIARNTAERPTAEWLEEYHYDYTEIVCSNCNKMFRYDFGGDRLWKYCPNCGSRMEGDNQCD